MYHDVIEKKSPEFQHAFVARCKAGIKEDLLLKPLQKVAQMVMSFDRRCGDRAIDDPGFRAGDNVSSFIPKCQVLAFLPEAISGSRA